MSSNSIEYKPSKFIKLLNRIKYAAKIKKNSLKLFCINGYQNININDIRFIKLVKSNTKKNAYAFCIVLKNEQLYYFVNTLFNKKTFVKFINRLLKLNTNIEIDISIKDILAGKEKLELGFKFKIDKTKTISEIDKEFSKKHPVLDLVIALTGLLFLILGVFVGGAIGIETSTLANPILKPLFYAVGFGSLAFPFTNIVAAYFGAYLGHKVTYYPLLFSLVTLAIGIFCP
ncbi:hypothetical protein IMX26_06075 [Clostridium sp. 'deep sea']|uniref:hypothetical protein n=1 Tax=Clostridium sp. 'deep sea' TaxID=2779445 RepID=UPI00189642A7|nr:hypothetical protein [Clostridium sp. 'deep sea']QOR36379.1 hypothetical protein IMX26_06075 [Clostridium sp. 'deep sea']